MSSDWRLTVRAPQLMPPEYPVLVVVIMPVPKMPVLPVVSTVAQLPNAGVRMPPGDSRPPVLAGLVVLTVSQYPWLYVYAPALVPVSLPRATDTSTAPAACAGVVAVRLVSLTTVTSVAAVPPRVTVGAALPANPLPVMVMGSPPVVRPEAGLTPVTVMTAGATYVKPPMRSAVSIQ